MKGKQTSWLLRAGALLLAALMVFGNLCLPNGFLKASAEETSTVLFSNDFEKDAEGALKVSTSMYNASVKGWTTSGSLPTGASLSVKTMNGNKVLALSREQGTSSFNVKYNLTLGDQTYNQATISYNVALSDPSLVAFFPAIGNANGGGRTAYFGINSSKFQYSTTGSNPWYDIEPKVELEANKWYTVKINYTAAQGEEAAKVEVYIDGQLTNVALMSALDIGSFIMGMYNAGNGGTMYMDNIQITEGDHTPAEKPASLIPKEEVDESVVLKTGFEKTEGFTVGKFAEGTAVKGWNAVYQTDDKGAVEIVDVNGNQVLAVSTVARASSSENTDVSAYYMLPNDLDYAVLTYNVAQTEPGVLFFPSVGNNRAYATRIGINGGMKYCENLGSEKWYNLTDGEGNAIANTVNKWQNVKIIFQKTTEGETVTITTKTYVDGVLTNATVYSPSSTASVNCVVMSASKFGSGTMYIDNLTLSTEDHDAPANPADIVVAPPVDESVVLKTGFEKTEGFSTGKFTANTDYNGWKATYANSEKGSVEIVDVNGNQVLAVSTVARASSSENTDVSAYYQLPADMDYAVLTYNVVQVGDGGVLFFPSIGKDGSYSVRFGENVGFKHCTRLSSGADDWKLMKDSSGVNELPHAANKWHSVKIIFQRTVTDGTASIQVQTFVDGVLSDAGVYMADQTGAANRIVMAASKFGSGTMYIDNLTLSTEDHDAPANPADIVVVPPVEEDKELVNINFEDGTLGGIYVTDSEKAYANVIEKNGNKLMAIGNTDTANHGFAKIRLDKSYSKLTMSYHLGLSDLTGTLYIASPGANVTTKPTGNVEYSVNGNDWTQLTSVENSEIGATVAPMTWYTIKIAFDSSASTPVRVWIDGVEMKTLGAGVTSINQIFFKMSKWMNNQIGYVDNIRITTGDHEPAAKPASLIVKTESVKFAQETMAISANVPTDPGVVVTPADATEQGVVLTSSDESIAYIDKNDMIVGVANGTVTITADPVAEGLENITMQVTVTVIDAAKVEIGSEDLELPVGGHTVITATVSPENTSFANIVFTSSDASVATIDEYGEIVALKAGTTTITAHADGNEAVSDSITVTVSVPTVMDTIYVAPNGKADAAGTKADPVNLQGALTLIAAKNDNMTGNIEVVLAGGYYYLSETLKITEAHSGTNNYSVVWKAAEGETPVLGTAYTVSGSWTKDETTGIYSVDVPAWLDSRQLFVDNVRAVRARSEGGLTACTFKFNGSTNVGYTCKDTELAGFANPTDLELVFKEEWTQPRIGVASITDNGDGTIGIVVDQPGWRYMLGKGQTQPKSDGPVWIENALELLDAPGEWYLDTKNDKLYYMPRAWENMSDVTVTLPTMDQYNGGNEQQLVLIAGSSYDDRVENIHFEGITFADTTWLRPNSSYGHSDVQNNHIRESGDKMQTAAVVVKKANAVWFTGCTFTRLGITGLQLIDGVQNSFIIGNHFYDISGGAINVGEPYITADVAYAQGNAMMKNDDIFNNYIHDIGVDYGSAAAISVGFAADMDMNHNEIFDIPYSGWHIGYGWNNRFPNNTKNMLLEYNFVHDFMDQGIYDGGGIYVLGNTSNDGYNIARYNYFRKQMDAHGALYPDQGTTYFKFIENVVDLSEVDSWRNGALAPRWMLTNQYAEHVHFIDNYITTENHQISSLTDTIIDLQVPKQIVDPTAKWEGTNASAIMEKAGLEAAYAHLRNNQAERIVTDAPKNGVEMTIGKTFALNVRFTDGKDKTVTGGSGLIVHYDTEDANIATVSEDGVITAVAQGITTIRVWVVSNDILDIEEIKIVVGDGLAEAKLVGVIDEISMSTTAAGKQLSAIAVTALGRELTPDSVAYAVADKTVAAVTADGLLTPVAAGTTTLTVTATVNGDSVTTLYKVIIKENVEFVEYDAWEIFDKEKEETWHKSGAQSWELVDDTSITTQINGYATFTGAQYADELLSFKLKVDASKAGGGWTPALVLRAQGTSTYVSAGVDGYILCMGQNGLELYRYVNGVRNVIYGNFYENTSNVNINHKQGDAIKDSAWTFDANKVAEHDIKIGAISDGGDVRIVLYVDGKEVINYLDKAENGAFSNAGYFGIIGRGETWVLTKDTSITDEEPMAQIGQNQYASVSEALENAKEGDCVQMLADAEVDNLILTKGVTLDLNGNTLTADYVVAFDGNAVIDSVNGVGVLKSENVSLDADNGAMPVWDVAVGGYRLFTMKSQQKYREKTEDGFEFIAKPVLDSHANDIFMAQSETNGLTIKVRLNWTSNSGKAVEQFFILDPADTKVIYSEDDKVIQLNVTGAGSYVDKLYTTCYIESETGVIWAPNGRLYTGE